MSSRIFACLFAVALSGAPAFSQETAKEWHEKGKTLYNQERYHAAIDAFTRAVELDPGKAHSYNWRGFSHFLLESNHEALADFDRALALKTDFVNMHYNRGRVRLRLEDYEGAVSDFSAGIQVSAEYRKGAQYYWRARSRSMIEASTETIQDFTRALEHGFEYRYEVYVRRGLANRALERNREAFQDFAIAAQIDTGNPEAFVNRGELAYVMKRYGQAEHDLSRALKIDPTESTACLYMGLIDLIMGRYDAATERFTVAMSTDSDRMIALHNLATVCLLTNRPGKADKLLSASWEEFDTQTTNYVYAVVSRYFGLLKLGEEAKGRNLLEEAYREAAPPGWAYPLFRYLNGDWTEADLFDAFDEDPPGLTMCRAVIGLEELYAGRPADAMPHLRWVAHEGSAAPFSTQALLEYRNRVAENAELTDVIPAAVYFDPDPVTAGGWGRIVAEYIPFPGNVVVEETWTIRSPGLTSPPLRKTHVVDLENHRQLIDFRVPVKIEPGPYELCLTVAFGEEKRRLFTVFEIKPPR